MNPKSKQKEEIACTTKPTHRNAKHNGSKHVQIRKLNSQSDAVMMYEKPYHCTNNSQHNIYGDNVSVNCDVCCNIIEQDAMFYHSDDEFDICCECWKAEQKSQYKYVTNEKVLCFSSNYNQWYAAQVIKRSTKKAKQYLIHYIGWHKMWDEWVDADHLCKGSNNKDILNRLLKNKSIEVKLTKKKGKKRKLNIEHTETTMKKRKLKHKSKASNDMNEWSVDDALTFIGEQYPEVVEKYSDKFEAHCKEWNIRRGNILE
eukprot:1129383_1